MLVKYLQKATGILDSSKEIDSSLRQSSMGTVTTVIAIANFTATVTARKDEFSSAYNSTEIKYLV